MAKTKKPLKTAENAPKRNVTYGLLNDGEVTVSISVDVDAGIASGLVYIIKERRQLAFTAPLKEETNGTV